MIRRLLVLSIAMAAVLCAGVAIAQDAAAQQVEKGKAVFNAAKPACKACHNEKKNPLDKFGASAETPEEGAERAKGWIRTPKDMFAKTGKKGMMPGYSEKKMSDEDLEALTAYLVSMK